MKLGLMFFTPNAYLLKNRRDTDETELTDLHRWGCSFASFIVIVVRKGAHYACLRKEVGKRK